METTGEVGPREVSNSFAHNAYKIELKGESMRKLHTNIDAAETM